MTSTSVTSASMTLAEQISQTLKAQFSPQFIEVENESDRHHSGKGGNSHFKITMVTNDFDDKALLARHRAVQKAIAELTTDVHAIGLHTYTPTEWQARGEVIPESAQCGG